MKEQVSTLNSINISLIWHIIAGSEPMVFLNLLLFPHIHKYIFENSIYLKHLNFCHLIRFNYFDIYYNNVWQFLRTLFSQFLNLKSNNFPTVGALVSKDRPHPLKMFMFWPFLTRTQCFLNIFTIALCLWSPSRSCRQRPSFSQIFLLLAFIPFLLMPHCI